MNAKKTRRDDSADLRRRAEEMAREKASRMPGNLDTLSPGEVKKALHELQVHQIELEMQNEELRRAREELETSQARYFDLYDLAPVSYFLLSEQGVILEANLTAATQLEMARSTLVKQPLCLFILPEDQDIYYLLCKQLFATGAPQTCEVRMVRKDAALFWTRLGATLSQDADGAMVCRVVVSDITEHKRADEALQQAHDKLEQRVTARTKELLKANEELRAEIAERKQAEEALKESESTLRNMAEQLVDVLFVTDDSGFITFISPSVMQMFGWKPEDIVGRSFIELLPESEISAIVAQLKHVLASGQPTQTLPLVMKRKDESTFPAELKSSVLRKDGRTAGTIGMIRDITERKWVEKELQESEDRYRNQMESINDVAYSIDSGGEITYISPVVKDVLGYEPEEMTGKDFLGFVHSEDRCHLKRKFPELREGVLSHHEVRLIGKSGEIKRVRMLTSPIMEIEGFAGGRGVLINIIEHKLAEKEKRSPEERLQRAEKREARG
jgi:PAS domain S-box-containing protein